jgi:hypothetical protein
MKNTRKFGFLAMLAMLVTFSACNKDEVLKSLEVAFGDSEVSVAENADPITITVEFPEESKVNAEVALMIEGTAVYGTDYTTSPAVESDQLTFEVAKGDASVSFTFTPIDDDFYTEDLTVTATLIEAKGIDLGENSSVAVTITDDGDASNETIDLGDGEAFNMANFVTSFEQIFEVTDPIFWSFDHSFSGGLLVESTRYNSAFGGYFSPLEDSEDECCGPPIPEEPVYFIEHDYEDGVVVSSSITSFSSDEAGFVLSCFDYVITYTFDDEGFIAKTQTRALFDGVAEAEFEFNAAGQLTTRTETSDDFKRVASPYGANAFELEPESDETVKTLTYNSDGTIASVLESSFYGDYFMAFTYTGGLATQAEQYYGTDATGELIATYSLTYDAENRITEIAITGGGEPSGIEEPNEVMQFSYTATTGSMSYYEEEYEVERLVYRYGGALEQNWEFSYGCVECRETGLPPAVLEFVRVEYLGEYTEDVRGLRLDGPGLGCQVPRQYVERIDVLDENEDLIGYVTIDERVSYGYKLAESVYDADGTLLYTLDFSVDPGDYCDVVITDVINSTTYENVYDEGSIYDNAPWYEDVFPDNGFCD